MENSNLPILDDGLLIEVNETEKRFDLKYMSRDNLKKSLASNEDSVIKSDYMKAYYDKMLENITDNIKSALEKSNSNKHKVDENFEILYSKIKHKIPDFIQEDLVKNLISLVIDKNLEESLFDEAFNIITGHSMTTILTLSQREQITNLLKECLNINNLLKDIEKQKINIVIRERNELVRSGLFSESILDSVTKIEDSIRDKTLIKFTRNLLYTDKNIIGIKCEHCSNGRDDNREAYIKLENNLVAIVVVPIAHVSNKLDIMPLVNQCPVCKSLVCLDQSIINSLERSPEVSDLSSDINSPYKSAPIAKSYIPSRMNLYKYFEDRKNLLVEYNYEKNLLLSDTDEELLFIEGDAEIETDVFSEYSSNDTYWDKAVKDFYDTLSTLVSVMEGNGEVSSHRDIAKLVGSLYSDYDIIKEDSVNTVLFTMDKLGFSSFGIDKIYFSDMISNIENLNSIKRDFLVDFIPLLSLKNNATKTKIIEELESIRDFDFDNRLKSMVTSFKKNMIYLMGIDIIRDLPEKQVSNLKAKYLYNPLIVDLVDLWSDLLIISNFEEDIFNNLAEVQIRKDSNKIQHGAGLSITKKSILDVNKQFKLHESTNKLFEKLDVDASSSFFNTIKTPYHLEVLENATKSLINKDYYDLCKYLKVLKDSPDMGVPDFLVDVYNLCDFKILSKSKFDYYFNFECDKIIQDSFLEVFSNKKFVPVEFKGASISKKLEWYKSLTKKPDECIELPEKIWDYCLENLGDILPFTLCNNYKEFGLSFAIRELFLDCRWAIRDKESLYRVLSINEELAVSLIDDCSYSLSVRKSTVKLEDVCTMLPVYYSNKLENRFSYKDNSKLFAEEILENYDEVSSYLSQFSGLDKYLERVKSREHTIDRR